MGPSDQNSQPAGAAEPPPPKGLCIETRCYTVEQFIATFQRYCEDAAILIPNARRDVGTTLPFSFDLVHEDGVLIGIGTVVEELANADNRFGRPGIVLSVQKLKRESIAVFERMIAARREAESARAAPAPVFARTLTGPIVIPALHEQTPKKSRARAPSSLPSIAKPVRPAVVRIPEARGSRPHVAADEPDDGLGGDTVRDDFPFALRNELHILEERISAVMSVAEEVDAGWDESPESLDAQTTPKGTSLSLLEEAAIVEEPIEEYEPEAWWQSPARWFARLAIATILLVAALHAMSGESHDKPVTTAAAPVEQVLPADRNVCEPADVP